MKALDFLLPLFTLVILCSCNATESTESTSHPSFEYSVDTISYPGSLQTIMRVIWGSKNDLWIAGHNELGRGKMFHYDGKKWTDVPINYSGFMPEFNSVCTIDSSIYLGGSAVYYSGNSTPRFKDSTLILRRNKNSWIISQHGMGGNILSIGGNANLNRYFAGGTVLSLFEYKNNFWAKRDISNLIPEVYETENINSITVDDNNNMHLIIFCYNPDPYYSYNYYFRDINGVISKADSFHTDLETAKWGMQFWNNNSGSIYSFNPGVYRLSNETWSTIFPYNELITALDGENDNNIFAAGFNLWHFNGTDWMKLKDLERYGFARDILIINNQVFVLCSDGIQSYIINCTKNIN